MENLKKCNKCNQLFPLSGFNKNKSYKDGLFPMCRDCFRIVSKHRRHKYKNSIKKTAKKYYENNKERLSKVHQIYRDNNREQLNIKQQQRYENNKEAYAKYHKDRYEQNKDKILKACKIYRDNNKDKIRMRSSAYIKTEAGQLNKLRNKIASKSNIPSKDIPKELLELKLQHLKIKRLLKEKNNVQCK